MPSFNKIILVGNLTRDPQLSYLPSQTPVVEFGLAINRRWRSQDGQQRESVCFVDCRCYGQQAETIKKYTGKGRCILVEGRLELDQWTDQQGQKRSRHRVFVERFQFMDSGGGQGGGGGRQGGDSYANQGNQGNQGGGYSQGNQGGGGYSQGNQGGGGGYDDGPSAPFDEDVEGEDIPF